jgi:hypothetical protein
MKNNFSVDLPSIVHTITAHVLPVLIVAVPAVPIKKCGKFFLPYSVYLPLFERFGVLANTKISKFGFFLLHKFDEIRTK